MDSHLIVCVLQYDGWPSGMEMPPTSMYGDHRAALDTLAAHHAAAQQHMNHSSRHNNIAFPPPANTSQYWVEISKLVLMWELIFFTVKLCTLKVQFLIKFSFLIFLIYKPNFSLLLAWDRRAEIRIIADRSFNVFCKIYTADTQSGSTNKSELKNLIFHKTWILSHNFSNFAEKKIR